MDFDDYFRDEARFDCLKLMRRPPRSNASAAISAASFWRQDLSRLARYRLDTVHVQRPLNLFRAKAASLPKLRSAHATGPKNSSTFRIFRSVYLSMPDMWRVADG